MIAKCKLGLLILWLALCYVPLWPLTKFGKWPLRDKMARLCHLGILRIIGIKVITHGTLSSRRPLLLVSNHISYLDIFVLGSLGPVCYTPKSEIAGWPVIRDFCWFSDSVFIDRRPEKTLENKERIQAVLAKGNIICLFPEGSTGDGRHMLPFKSSFFQIAEEGVQASELYVQPVALSYVSICKLPISVTQWPLIAWYADMELIPHMKELLALGPITVIADCMEPLTIGKYGNRKALAAACQQKIAESIELYRK